MYREKGSLVGVRRHGPGSELNAVPPASRKSSGAVVIVVAATRGWSRVLRVRRPGGTSAPRQPFVASRGAEIGCLAILLSRKKSFFFSPDGIKCTTVLKLNKNKQICS